MEYRNCRAFCWAGLGLVLRFVLKAPRNGIPSGFCPRSGGSEQFGRISCVMMNASSLSPDMSI
eukprot:1159961-Pelagomonas_calceolata.AAC.2